MTQDDLTALERLATEHMRTQDIYESETVRVERAYLAGASAQLKRAEDAERERDELHVERVERIKRDDVERAEHYRLVTERDQLHESNARLVAALKFYAALKPEQLYAPTGMSDDEQVRWLSDPANRNEMVKMDGGRVARAALAKAQAIGDAK